MKLGKTHLIVSLVMVAASIAYNVWVFTRPAARTSRSSPAPLIDGVQPSGPVVTGEAAGAAAIDPASVPAPPDVELARAPEWPRNPFVSGRMRRPEVVVAATNEVEADPDVVVASILHSPERQLAVVNGRIVRVGDRVGANTIIDIQPRAIVVESPRTGRRTIELRTLQTKRDPQ